MEGIAKKRPVSVAIVGWIFILLASLMILSGVIGFIAFCFMKQTWVGNVPPTPKGIFGLVFKDLSMIFPHFGFGFSSFLQIIFALFVLIASIQFLKLRAWARTALEVVSWLSLVYVVVLDILWVRCCANPTSSFAVIGFIKTIVIYAVPLIVIIKFLRGKTIKEAVA